MGAGRPSKYREEFAQQAYKLCLLGLTDAELAKYFEIAESTLNLWKEGHPEFMEALKAGRAQADAKVAEKLYRRATGYSHVDTKFATFEGQITDQKEYIKHHPPDTTAAIFWLKNRQKKHWRDKIDHGVEGAGPEGGPIRIMFVSPSEVEEDDEGKDS